MKINYDVILADPPWHFKVWNEKTGSGRSASQHYNIMSIQDICDLPVQQYLAPNAALFLWTTWPTIFEYPQKVFEAWGFTYRTEAWVWVKPAKVEMHWYPEGAQSMSLSWQMGLGYYTRANSEPCLLAVRGSMPVAVHDVIAIISEPRREHSRKPDAQYEMIEQLYPDANYLELFARSRRRGWHAWGNEVESDIEF